MPSPSAVLRGLSIVLAAMLIGCSGAPGGSTATPAGPSASSPIADIPTDGAPTDVAPTGPSMASPTEPASGAPGPTSPTSAPSVTPDPTQPTGSSLPARSWLPLELGEGPGPRSDQTWTVDGDGSFAYLFGGTSEAGPLDDLWRFDLAADTWERLEPQGDRPSARFGHVAAWVAGQGLVIWSGQAGSDFFNDLWAFDPAAGVWQRLPDGGAVPGERYGSCGAVGPDGRLWISHGFTAEGRFDDTRAYDFAAGAWQDVSPRGSLPVKRCLHDCLWTPDGRFLLYAGQTDGQPALGDLWSLDPAEGWSELPRPEPAPRQLYALATLGGTAYVFGGRDEDGRYLDDAFSLSLSDLAWTTVEAGDGPSPRSGATLIGDPNGQRVLLFGGVGRDGAADDLWELVALE